MVSAVCKQSTARNCIGSMSIMCEGISAIRKISFPKLQKARRALFQSDTLDPKSNENFVREQLKKQTVSNSIKWNFDFDKEKMLDSNGAYVWSLDVMKKPERHIVMPRKQPITDNYDNSHLYFCAKESVDVPKIKPIVVDTAKSSTRKQHIGNTSKNKKPIRQLAITDYMPARKRSAPEPSKKASNSTMPMKKARLTTS